MSYIQLNIFARLFRVVRACTYRDICLRNRGISDVDDDRLGNCRPTQSRSSNEWKRDFESKRLGRR